MDSVMQWQNTLTNVWFQPEDLHYSKMERVVEHVIGYLIFIYNNLQLIEYHIVTTLISYTCNVLACM